MFGSIARRFALAAAVAVLAFLPPFAAAQGLLLLGVGQPPAGGGGGSYVGPGDVVSGAKVWLGLRAYTTAQAAAHARAILVVRASDGQSCDVLLATTGGLGNTASCSAGFGTGPVATFCAATTCFIDVFYDQSGNGWDFPANTSANRAVLAFNCIGTQPCADFAANFGGPAFYFSSPSITATADGYTVSAVAIRTGSFTAQNDLFARGTATFFDTANTISVYSGNQASATATDNVWHAFQIVGNNTSSAFGVDATQTTGLDFGSLGQFDTLFLAADNSAGTSPLNGKLTEIGMWPIAFSGTQMTNVCHNQFTYWGTPTSC